MLSKNKTEILLFIVGIILSALMFKTLMIHTDNTQLMDKAVKIHDTGIWTHHGNAATKMGSLPGSFLTFVTAVPMMVWYSPYAACAIILLFHVLSYFLLRYMGYQYSKDFNPVYLAIFYWLNPWRVEQSELYNPGYLFLFSTLQFYCLYQMSKRHKFLDSFLLVLATGFCFQVHFSVLILGVSFLYLFWKKQIKVHYIGFATGCLVIGLSLLPWFLEQLSGQTQSLQTQSDAFFGKNLLLVYPVLKSIIYFFRMGSVYFGRHIFSEINFDWIGSEYLKIVVGYLFHALKWILAAVTMCFSGRFFWQFYKDYKNNKSERSFFVEYLVSIAMGVLVSAGLSPVEFNHWHLVLSFPIIIFYILSTPEKYFYKIWDRYKKEILYFFTITFVVWNLFASLGSRSHNANNDYERDFKLHYQIKTEN